MPDPSYFCFRTFQRSPRQQDDVDRTPGLCYRLHRPGNDRVPGRSGRFVEDSLAAAALAAEEMQMTRTGHGDHFKSKIEWGTVFPGILQGWRRTTFPLANSWCEAYLLGRDLELANRGHRWDVLVRVRKVFVHNPEIEPSSLCCIVATASKEG